MKQQLKLLTMSDIPAEDVRWLWRPYLPRGKITIIQGDPGDGKTTFVLALTALLTRGLPMSGGGAAAQPMNVIYQTAEDGLADTVRPRLDAMGADCSRVLVIDEGERELTLLAMSDIPAEDVRWLWRPYLPRGKITIIQGTPGDGKTTFVLALAALLTHGLPMPGGSAEHPSGGTLQRR